MRRILTTFTLLIALVLPAYANEVSMSGNGTTFIAIPRQFTNTVAIQLFVKGGIVRETKQNNGVGNLLGTTWLKSSRLMHSVENVGATLDTSVSGDFFEFSMAAPSEHLSTLLADLETLFLNPAFDPQVFDREKAIQLQEIKAQFDNPNSLAYRRFAEVTYGSFPYALPAEGNTESVTALTLADIKKHFSSLMQGRSLVVVMTGRYTEKEEKRVRELFGKLPAGEAFTLVCDADGTAKDVRIEETDPRIQQAKLYIGYDAPVVSDPAYVSVKVLTDLLGSGMSSRYFTELRKKRGYAYSVGAAYPSRLCASRFIGFIGLDAANVDSAVTQMHTINTTLMDDLTEAELEKTKNHIIGTILIESQTNAKIAWYAAFFESLGLGSTYFSTYIDRLRHVGKEDLLKGMEIFNRPKSIYVLKPAPAAQ